MQVSPLTDMEKPECYEPPTKRRILECVKADHTYSSTETFNSLAKKLSSCKSHINLLKKKLKCSNQKSRRLKNNIKSLKSVVKALRNKNMISSNCEERLNKGISGVPLAIIKRLISKKRGNGCKYPPELRSFALTLQFYSAKAYEFIRKTFNLCLPHQAHLRKWYGKIPAEPGFTKPAFDTIRTKVEVAKDNGQKVVCSLMLDEMSIRKHVAWDGIRYRGFVDLGDGIEDDDSLPVAKDVLVLMAVCINGSWKVPCGYFFIDGLSGCERANLISVCLQRLWDTGVQAVSVTCDGPSCHFTMMKELGASLSLEHMDPAFPHPVNSDEKVSVILDVCHMLKLVRNTFAAGGVLVDRSGGRILWQYVKDLNKLQQKEGLRLANKLKASHINWHQQKMKVNIAAQSLSSSVADAIEYCANVLKLPQFQNSEATVSFIRMFDHLFDILNSRNPFARGYKSALRISNKCVWNPFLNEAYSYIAGLKEPSGNLICHSRRKTGFIGFLASIRSTQALFETLVENTVAPLKYLLTYKLSQDHLELFFCAIRSAGGFNNNPTAQQFTAAYKRLLLRSGVDGGGGNCQRQDQTALLHVNGDTYNINDQQVIYNMCYFLSSF